MEEIFAGLWQVLQYVVGAVVTVIVATFAIGKIKPLQKIAIFILSTSIDLALRPYVEKVGVVQSEIVMVRQNVTDVKEELEAYKREADQRFQKKQNLIDSNIRLEKNNYANINKRLDDVQGLLQMLIDNNLKGGEK
ncbi:hypothetical protein [Listeria rocourtiae]|uniref:hypothetical protein n=1 Tax=Listeria rocourtiae TaxID=647910 RepID=UPI003D2F7602